ncbi:hypothetical protein [Scytonema sp. NUACC26]|uniref:hypothetical protein n=1 Tax=Scytonema sp. NUACC26 TaxID=3140176 RepID=UPI0034DCA543
MSDVQLASVFSLLSPPPISGGLFENEDVMKYLIMHLMAHLEISSLWDFINYKESQAFIVLFFISFGLGIAIATIRTTPSNRVIHTPQNIQKKKSISTSKKVRSQ